jgi:hypothetical protein
MLNGPLSEGLAHGPVFNHNPSTVIVSTKYQSDATHPKYKLRTSLKVTPDFCSTVRCISDGVPLSVPLTLTWRRPLTLVP